MNSSQGDDDRRLTRRTSLTRSHSTLTANIRERRGSLVDIRVPLFIDENTEQPEGTDAPMSNGHASEPPLACLTYLTKSPVERRSSRQTGTGHAVHPHGRHGVWNGMLLSPNHVPGVESRRGEEGV